MKTAAQILTKHLPGDVHVIPEMVYASEEFARQETARVLQQLQSQVHKITGDGEVMKLFNAYLGISAS